MEDSLFQLRFCCKQLDRESKRCEKAHNQEKAKIKKALQQGNVEGKISNTSESLLKIFKLSI